MRLFVGLGTAWVAAWVAVCLCLVAASAADLPADLRTLIEQFQAHRRVALGYLRSGNADLGAIELERLRSDWAGSRRTLAASVAAAADLARALDQTETAAAASLKAVDAGDVDEARALLERGAAPLDAWRHAQGIRLFADCIAEFAAVYRRLDTHRLKAPDLTDAAIRETIRAASASTAAAAARCDQEAPSSMRGDAEFRRLIEGLLASLRQMPDALRLRDGNYLRRLLDEQRAFDRLLAFRYG